MSETTYYQRNRDVILNRAKDYARRDNARRIYLKKKKIKRENMEEIDVILCLKKRNKN